MELTFYIQVAQTMDRTTGRVARLRVVKTTMEPPDVVTPGAVVIRVPLEIPLEIFEPATAEKMAVSRPDVTIPVMESPLQGTMRLAEELSS